MHHSEMANYVSFENTNTLEKGGHPKLILRNTFKSLIRISPTAA